MTVMDEPLPGTAPSAHSGSARVALACVHRLDHSWGPVTDSGV